jgi:hypothetical protein
MLVILVSQLFLKEKMMMMVSSILNMETESASHQIYNQPCSEHSLNLNFNPISGLQI